MTQFGSGEVDAKFCFQRDDHVDMSQRVPAFHVGGFGFLSENKGVVRKNLPERWSDECKKGGAHERGQEVVGWRNEDSKCGVLVDGWLSFSEGWPPLAESSAAISP